MGTKQNAELWIWGAILVPILIFYSILFCNLSSIPTYDDYRSLLALLLDWKQGHDLTRIITMQSNEYRLMFENAIFVLQYQLFGRADLKVLEVVGDLFVLPIFAALYLIWNRRDSMRATSLVSFVPVAWMLFQLQYVSTVNAPMAALQNLPVHAFALLACYLMPKEGRWNLAGAIGCLILAIASSGSGLFLIPIGLVIYLQMREWIHGLIWCAFSALLCAVYFLFGYNFHATHGGGRTLGSSIEHLSPIFSLAFLGSAGTSSHVLPAVIVGFCLFAVFVLAIKDKLYQSDPSCFYAMLFLVITAIAVSGTRSDYMKGVTTAIGSRYRINSVIMMILAYYYLADKLRVFAWKKTVQWAAVCVLGVILAGFNFASNWMGRQYLKDRILGMEKGILRWEGRLPAAAAENPAATRYAELNEKLGIYDPDGEILEKVIREGIYRLPNLPEEH